MRVSCRRSAAPSVRATTRRYDPAMSVIADIRIPMRPLTVDVYERMIEAGILTEDDRVELLKGQLSEVSPQSPQHAALTQWLSGRLIRAIDPDVAGVRVQLPLRLAPVSEPEPDIAIVRAGAYGREHPTGALLVIEIALSSRALDLGAKAEVYAAAGVGEYWVVDVPARTIHVHDSPAGDSYQQCRQVASGALRPPLAEAPQIDVEALFSVLD